MKCPEHTYYNKETKSCILEKKCSANCKECSYGHTCTKCDDPYNLDHTGKCITCGPAKYFYQEYKFCAHCPKNCETCKSDDKCLTCKNPFVVDSRGQCRLPCPKGTFFNPQLQKCDKCPDGTFLSNKKRCITCTPPKVM